jgi:hypothetical protein
MRIDEFKELDAPTLLTEGTYVGKYYVGVAGAWEFYLRDDGDVHVGALPFTNDELSAGDTSSGYFDTEEDAVAARLAYYRKHDQLDLLV